MFLEFVQISLIFPIKRQYFSCKPHIFLVRFICVYFIICYYCENGIYLISPITFSIVFSKSFHKIIIIFLKPYHGFCSTEKKNVHCHLLMLMGCLSPSCSPLPSTVTLQRLHGMSSSSLPQGLCTWHTLNWLIIPSSYGPGSFSLCPNLQVNH